MSQLVIILTHRPEGELYRIARQHARSSRARHDEGNHFPDELYESLQVVILASAALEAFINGQGGAAYGPEWEQYEEGKLPGDTHRPNLLEKWFDVPQKLNAGTPVFDKGKQPFQGLKRIVQLRNYALHYHPIPKPPRGSVHGNVSEFAGYFDYRAGQRSAHSMHRLLSDFHRILLIPCPIWLGSA